MDAEMKTRLLERYHTDDELTSEAAALYDGGWRYDDLEDLIEEYDISLDHAQALCLLFEEYEKEA